MKIKIIDLLVKLANGEEVPKKIKCYGKIFQLEENGFYYCYDNDFQNDWVSNLLSNELTLSTNELNDYLEIIEEPKKIEKINDKLGLFGDGNTQKIIIELNYTRTIINELIDEINNLKEKQL